MGIIGHRDAALLNGNDLSVALTRLGTGLRAHVPVVYTWSMGLEVHESERGDCLFCGIVERDPGDQIFFADHDVVAFLDIAPATRGHTLVVPRLHADTAFDVGGDEFSATMRGAKPIPHRTTRTIPDP